MPISRSNQNMHVSIYIQTGIQICTQFEVRMIDLSQVQLDLLMSNNFKEKDNKSLKKKNLTKKIVSKYKKKNYQKNKSLK